MLSYSDLYYQTSFLLLAYVNAYNAIYINGNPIHFVSLLFKRNYLKI